MTPQKKGSDSPSVLLHPWEDHPNSVELNQEYFSTNMDYLRKIISALVGSINHLKPAKAMENFESWPSLEDATQRIQHIQE